MNAKVNIFHRALQVFRRDSNILQVPRKNFDLDGIK